MSWRGMNHVNLIGKKSDGFTEEMSYDIKELKIDGVGAMRAPKALSADTTLLATDSGGTFFLDATGEAIILPAPAIGLKFKFIAVDTVAVSAWTITTASNATIIFGSVTVAGLVVAGASEDTITFSTDAIAGDWCEIVSDGTNWYVSGQATASGGITLTDES